MIVDKECLSKEWVKIEHRRKVLPLFNEAHELSSIFISTRRTAQRRKIK